MNSDREENVDEFVPFLFFLCTHNSHKMPIISPFVILSYLNSSHEIVLRRSHPGSWGFSIVGGYEDNHTNQAFFIKTIVLGTPAYYDGRLK